VGVAESKDGDWLSDHEIQLDYQDDLSLSAADAYARMVPDLTEWIQQGVVVPGDVPAGFEAWPGSRDELSERFAAAARRFTVIERPGQICWFDLGPGALTGD
jgi:hypothetical protein